MAVVRPAGLLLVASLLTACGAGDDGGSSAPQGPTGPWQRNGTEVSFMVADSHRGAAECGQQDVHYLTLGWLGETTSGPRKPRQFIRDPDDSLNFGMAEGFAADVKVPADAVDTGLRNGGLALWTSRAGDRVFLVGSGPGAGEQWPAAPYAVGCD